MADSDPRYSDPDLHDPMRRDLQRSMAAPEEQSNAMWGWIAGAVVIALLLLFVFARTPNNSSGIAQNPNPAPAETTGAAPRAPAPAR